MKTLFYYFGVAAFFTHEMDAVLNLEWQLLFSMFELAEPTASAIFIGLHFPIFIMFFYLGHHNNPNIKSIFRSVVCCFLVVHGILHFGLSNHELYLFEGLISNLYIFGAAVFSMAFLVVSWKQRVK